MIEKSHSNSITILVCQGKTCSASGSAKVFDALQLHSPPDIKITFCGCLGECGNGPMVLILPEKTWYRGVSCEAATMIMEQHLRCGKPVVNLLHRKFHPLPSYKSKSTRAYFLVLALSAILVLALTIAWILSLG